MRIFKAHEKTAYGIAITPDGSRLISSGRDDAIRMWDLSSGTMLWENRVYPPQGHLAISPDGKWLASACYGLGRVSIWDLGKDGKRIRELNGNRDGFLAFSPDGTRLSAAWYLNFTLWDTATWKEIAVVMRPPGIFGSAGFSPRSKSLHGGNEVIGGVYGGIALWAPDLAQQHFRLSGPLGATTHLAVSPDGNLAAAIAGKDLCVWDLEEKEIVFSHHAEKRIFHSAQFSPDGRTLATAGNDATVRFYDTEDWHPKAEYTWRIGDVLDVAFAPDGLRAAACGRSGKIVIWDVEG